MMTNDLDMFNQRPEEAFNNIKAGYAGLDPTGYKSLFPTAAMVGASEGEFNNLIKDFTPEEKETARRVKAGLKGRATGSASQTISEEGTAGQVGQSQATIAEQVEEAKGAVTGRQQRLNTLRTSKAGRQSSIVKANKFLKLLEGNKLQTGAGRKGASYIPGVYTKQGQLDEEFNAFSEIAARQALKASGELRPTDADVEGMKRAMFGIGRDEKVNINLLKDYITQQESDESEYFDLLRGKNAPLKKESSIDDLLKKYGN